MVSKPSRLFTKFLQMFLEKPYELPHKPLKAFVRYDFEIVSKLSVPHTPYGWKMTIFVSVISSTAYFGPSLPMPLSFSPP